MEKMSVLTLFPYFFLLFIMYLLFFSLVIGINPDSHVC